ncbi:FimV/HubP family polar landmark protein [Hydrogenophilus thermoluteolus]|nr:FimV/HubP family polar landmark protein [Hydrogenophilus thermoluteolus]
MAAPQHRMKKWLLAVTGGLALSPAFAASLGELTVASRLGEPLTAYVTVQADAAELRSMVVRLADEAAYRDAGITPSPLLPKLSARLIPRGAGWAVELKTREPVRDPFVNVLLDLRWNGGRILREYAILIDPPEYALPTQPVLPKAVAATRAVAEPNTQGHSKARTPADPFVPNTPGTRWVRPGDTLMKIARETQPRGVPLEVVLYALWQKNPEAFIGNDINRLQAGARLLLPTPDELTQVPVAEARSAVGAQLKGALAIHQQRVAEKPAVVAEKPAAAAKGSVVARASVIETESSAQAHDQVEVKPTQLVPPTEKGESETLNAAPSDSVPLEDWLALKGDLEEARERIAVLERQITQITQLLEVQNGLLAQLQQQAIAQQGTKATATPPAHSEAQGVEPAAISPRQSEPEKMAAAQPEAKGEASAPPQKTETEKPAVSDAAKTPPKAPADAPLPRSTEPSFLEFLLEQPALLAGAGGAVLLLVALLIMRQRKQREGDDHSPAAEAIGPATQSETQTAQGTQATQLKTLSTEPTPSRLSAASGQEVDTSASILGADFTQVAFNALQADEGIDPVTEAEVLLAYDRDQQAEEILLDALKETPDRPQIPLKLLEVYGKRGDRQQFDHYFDMVAALTGRSGKEWDRAVSLHERFFGPMPGAQSAPLAAATDAADQTDEETLRFDDVETPTEPQAALEGASDVGVEGAPESSPEPSTEAPLDFALDFDTAQSKEAVRRGETPEQSHEKNDTDVETQVDAVETARQPEAASEPELELDIDLDLDDLDFDLELESERKPQTESEPTPERPEGDAFGEMAESLEPQTETPSSDVPPNQPESAEPPKSLEAEEEITLPDLDLDAELETEQPMQPEGEPTSEAKSSAESTTDESMVTAPEDATVPDEPQSPVEEEQAEQPTSEAKEPATEPSVDLSVLPEVDLETVMQEEGEAPEAEIDDSRLQLALAYLDMEDFEGARELLEEVVRDGSPEAKAKAESLLAQLSG